MRGSTVDHRVQPNPRIGGRLFSGADSYALCLPEGAGDVLAVWYDTGTFDTIGAYVNRPFTLHSYVIDRHSSQSDTLPETGWEPILTESGNCFSTRQHALHLGGCRWIRIRFLRCTGVPQFRFDVHDASAGISDSWLFLGDSVTACAMGNAWGTSFAAHIHARDARFYPIQQNGGIGGLTSRDGRQYIHRWIADNPARFVPVAFGTNDAWGRSADVSAYESNLRYMLEMILNAGKIPVLPTIPYASDTYAGRFTAQYNAVVEGLYASYGDRLLHGPDFYAFFRDHPHLLGADGVHPSEDGYESMRCLWADTMYAQIYPKAEG